jgi:hypothetical protein
MRRLKREFAEELNAEAERELRGLPLERANAAFFHEDRA